MFIGVDIGGTNMTAGLFDSDKNLLATAKVKSKGKESTDIVLGQLFKVINKLLDDTTKASLKAIGIGIAGFVDSTSGVLKFSANLNLNGVCIKDEVSNKFGVVSFVENDVNVGVIGEWKHGAGIEHKNIVGIFVGTGIGGGLVVNNEFIFGETGGAGAVGHMTINKDGPYCQSCGSQGCLETYAGKVGIENRLRYLEKKVSDSVFINLVKENEGKLKSSHLQKALASNDKVAIEIMNDAMTNLGIAVANYINFINPSLVVFGGGVMSSIGEQCLPYIREVCTKYTFKSILDACEFKIVGLGNNSGIYGAMEVAANNKFRG